MKYFILFIALTGLSLSQEAATGDYVFRKKVARGYESVNITPDNSKVLGWTNGNLANVTGGSGGGTWASLTDKATAPLITDNTGLAAALAGKAPSASPTITGTLSAATITASGNITGANLSGTNTGDQTLPTASSLGLVIGTNVQAYDADLTTWAGVTPGAGVATALAVATNATGGFSPINGTATLTNKTLALGSNTITGTKAQFDTAITDDNVGWINSTNTWTGPSNIFNNGISTSALTTSGVVTFDAGSTFSYDTGIAALHRTALGLGALSTVTPGTGIVTALAINTGSAGSVQINNGSGSGLTGTAASLTAGAVTNLTLGGATTISTGGTIALGGFTLTVPATGTAALLGTANTFTAANNITLSNAQTQTNTITGLGVTTLPGLQVTNTTAASSGNQQYSPSVRWTGQGWKTTATAASQAVDFRAYVVPVQGTTNPTALWTLESSVNGGAFGNSITVDSTGSLKVRNGSSSAPSISFTTGGEGVCGFTYDGTNSIFVVAQGTPIAYWGYQKFRLGSTALMGWSSSQFNPDTTAFDTALYRNAAGVVEINNGTAGTYRDLKLRTLTPDSTVTAGGTTGAQTINKSAGSVNFAAAATSLVVTNSLVTTSSVIQCTIATNDATAANVKAVAGSGSFTIYLTAPTGECRVNFLLTN